MWYVIQLVMLLVTFFSVKEEFYATYPYREGVAPKGKESKLYHRWGAAFIVTICIALGFLSSTCDLSFRTQPLDVKTILLNGAVSTVLLGTWYWLVFNVGYAKSIGQSYDYLGDEASSDSFLKKSLGKNAGKILVFFCIGVIIALNVLYETILK